MSGSITISIWFFLLLLAVFLLAVALVAKVMLEAPHSLLAIAEIERRTTRLQDQMQAKGAPIIEMSHTKQGSVRSAGFSPDGKYIVSGSGDGTTRVWNHENGTTRFTLSSAREQWYAAEFDNNELTKITGTELSWKMANLAKGMDSWFLDDLACFVYQSADYDT